MLLAGDAMGTRGQYWSLACAPTTSSLAAIFFQAKRPQPEGVDKMDGFERAQLQLRRTREF